MVGGSCIMAWLAKTTTGAMARLCCRLSWQLQMLLLHTLLLSLLLLSQLLLQLLHPLSPLLLHPLRCSLLLHLCTEQKRAPPPSSAQLGRCERLQEVFLLSLRQCRRLWIAFSALLQMRPYMAVHLCSLPLPR